MDKREKVIKGLECCLPMTTRNGLADCEQCPYDRKITLEGGVTECCHDLMADALALLKEQEPRVMTAEDMWTLKFNDTVIIEQKIPPLLIPAIVRDNIKHDDALEVLQVVTASMDGGANADYDYYGKTWRCWTSRPTDEQREKVKWDE